MNLSFAWRVQFSQLSTTLNPFLHRFVHQHQHSGMRATAVIFLSHRDNELCLHATGEYKILGVLLCSFAFLPCFLRPFPCHAEVSRKRRLLGLRRGLSDLCRGCPARSIRRGEPLTSDFEDATLLSRSYRVGSVSVPGQPRWLNSICGEQDDPLPTLP